MTPRIAALVVTHLPDERIADRLDLVCAQIGRLLIVDNGSDAASVETLRQYARRDGVTLRASETNLGIAAALNIGLSALGDEGYDWVLTLDQDSAVMPHCVSELAGKIADDVAVVGANREDVGSGGAPHRWLRPRRRLPGFERVPCDRIGPEGVTLVITSGALTSTAAYRALGPLREEFFIDCVDFEYCLRARGAGFRVLVSCGARIRHRVGARSRVSAVGMSISPTHHSPTRRYYFFRNGVVTMRDYGRRFPHFLIYEVVAMVEVLLGIVLMEDAKVAKLRACVLGTWDGLHRRLGPVERTF